MRTENAVECGAQMELHLNGTSLVLPPSPITYPPAHQTLPSHTDNTHPPTHPLPGMLHAEFDPSDTKLTRLAVVFDVMGLMQQLRRCAGGPGRGSFPVAPSTLQMAEEPTEEARIVFAIQAPFRIRSINEVWLVDYGVTLRECQVRTMTM